MTVMMVILVIASTDSSHNPGLERFMSLPQDEL